MNKRGVALVLCYMVVAVLAILSTAFISRSISEGNTARVYNNLGQAFWIAEAGLAQGYYNWVNKLSQPPGAVNFGGGSYTINTANLPDVTVTAVFAGMQRIIRASFIRVPPAFQNTLSCGGDLNLSGLFARVDIYGQTRISGKYSKTKGATGWFEDKQEKVGDDYTTIKIPDYNNNGTSDEFADFVLFGQKAVQGYPGEQAVYIETDGTVNIFPSQSLVGKKVIFVEGSAPGQGNVNIFFDATWQEEEDLTVIATGSITYIEPLQFQTDSRLSAISWSDYNEASVFRSEHESVIYSHEDANFVDILDWGSTTGNIVANQDVSLREVLTYEKYYYSSRAAGGDLPPAFKWLSGPEGIPYLKDWREGG